jgi:hypothetical protein
VVVSFTTEQAYTGVTIAADLIGSFVGSAYLSNQIGAGTAVADVLAS